MASDYTGGVSDYTDVVFISNTGDDDSFLGALFSAETKDFKHNNRVKCHH